jgi:hypothetical protein
MLAGERATVDEHVHREGRCDLFGGYDACCDERSKQRGITIKSAVVSFAIDDVTVNLKHARPPGFHRRGGARFERARRRRAGTT